MADVFGHLNDVNSCLQGRDVTVCDVRHQLAGLTAQTLVKKARTDSESFNEFPFLNEYIAVNNIKLPTHVNKYIIVLFAEFSS